MGESPQWVLDFSKEELEFVKNFILTSGSIKDIANIYSISYPTIRKKLDRLIQKVRISERKENDSLVLLMNELEKEGKINQEVVQKVVSEYNKSLNCLI
ncbi:DUF2089 domain-containing protein [Enterococcus raffinosus]|uniref:DUF2089 family protein n=1 Tax=Enterococcus raffinosus TaxID=71452 RepID=UPI001C1099B3|nr:DUF2089 family protein [Enterococcus raffinosus]MBU5363685.1 DUF2089 domain-containing protein [Enterococcus raffinosus]